ncbi:heterokaryon incompatibility protein-domain-containing protein [Echria macrotheca]|uniref:Heterokaryon incompatibility protein-domain-containing protein n=1 Tax=Echria macrotheca TaxID=438768 RepID=A0AAJ0BI81_9PEZI|nr:heterokaryon incompatibility protein-domain-containing protein [Echria macrotheca]
MSLVMTELRADTLMADKLDDLNDDLIDIYTALSYVWGDPSRVGQILLDGQQFGITASLQNALRDIRDATREIRLWADAICINQEDVLERNSQVSMMGRIYATATNTIIYLGPLTAMASRALYIIDPRKSDLTPYRNAAGIAIDPMWEVAIGDILNRQWFQRVWIFQELVRSRDPWVQVGHARVRWDKVCDVVFRLYSQVGVNLDSETALEGERNPINILNDMNRARTHDDSRSLLQLLQARRGMGATDPRDMIFAHLGIASLPPGHAPYPVVDYTKSVSEVYLDVALYLLATPPEDMRNLKTLFEHLPARIQYSLGIPSWVPDWRLPGILRPGPDRENEIPLLDETLAADLFKSNTRYPKVATYRLATAGYLFDTVKGVGPQAPSASGISRADHETYKKNLRIFINCIHRATLSGNIRNLAGLLMDAEFFPTPSKEDLQGTFLKECRSWVGDLPGGLRPQVTPKHRDSEDTYLDGRRLILTAEGYFGAAPPNVQEGDFCVCIAPLLEPLVLRPMPAALVPKFDPEDEISCWASDLTITAASKLNPQWGIHIWPPGGNTKPGRYTIKETDVLHCQVVGKCRIYGFTPWRIPDGRCPPLREIAEFRQRILVLH